MQGYFHIYDLERIMKNALIAGLLVFAVVFLSGVIFGWWYGLLLGFVILLAISMINMVQR